MTAKNFFATIILLLATHVILPAQNGWERISSSQDECHTQISVRLERRLRNGLSSEKSYQIRAVLRNTQTTYDVAISIKGNKDSWARVTVPKGGTKTINLLGSYSATEYVSYQLSDREYRGLKLNHLSGTERYARCGEGSYEIQRRDR